MLAYTGRGSITHAGEASSYSSLPRWPKLLEERGDLGIERGAGHPCGDVVEPGVEGRGQVGVAGDECG